MIEQELKKMIIERYSSLSRFADEIDMAWTTLDGVLKRGVNKSKYYKSNKNMQWT